MPFEFPPIRLSDDGAERFVWEMMAAVDTVDVDHIIVGHRLSDIVFEGFGDFAASIGESSSPPQCPMTRREF